MGLPAPLLGAGYAELVRPVLFRSYGGDPEAIHERLIHLLAGAGSQPVVRALTGLLAGSSGRPATVAGVRFPSRVGLAAGLDKDATAVLAWQGLGFGFAELGTVTGRAQPGNQRPRVFRLPESKALINRMGFNNPGAPAVARTLSALNVYRGNQVAGIPIGISIGKTKVVDVADAVDDYLVSLRLLAPHADYVAVNVSSPNTPGLRSLQDAGALADLLGTLVAEAAVLNSTAPSAGGPVPVFVKVAPDLSWDQLDEVVATVAEQDAAGIIATNTTLARNGVAPADQSRVAEAGGLSGAPLTVRARQVVAHLRPQTQLPLIGVGGIMTAADATALFDAGADLVQLYTGFIYGGPGLVSAINALDQERQGS